MDCYNKSWRRPFDLQVQEAPFVQTQKNLLGADFSKAFYKDLKIFFFQSSFLICQTSMLLITIN
jgi:hypothetical protein